MSSSNGTASGSPSGTSVRGDLFKNNVRFLCGAEFNHRSTMNFEGEAEILCETIFHKSVTFMTDKVRIYGDAIYHGENDTSVLSTVSFDHITPNDLQDWQVRLVCPKLTHFSKEDGIAKFATGEKVEFHGLVVFKGAVTLVKPIFYGNVKFEAQPDIKSLPEKR